LIKPLSNLQTSSVNKTIKHVKMGNIKLAEKTIKPAIKYLIKQKCKKIILGCTEIPIAIFAYKSLQNAKVSKLYLDPNLILANSCMAKYKK
jgi:aspartate racemase